MPPKPPNPPGKKMRPIKSRKLIPEWMKQAAYTPVKDVGSIASTASKVLGLGGNNIARRFTNARTDNINTSSARHTRNTPRPDTRTGNFQRETGKYDDSGNEHVGLNTNAITPAVHIHLHGPSSTGMPLDIQKAAKLRNKRRN